ncbi:hypothetical protein P9990_23540 [Prescottella equi]|uniref:hypothetical protein n=1 Tax=Prescottella TaxID=2979332 RepID=UPI002574B3E3|nr:hypothetical protein [Prescottella equi]WJJ11495.1 hypothetical protein P9990_23540 [Prescottella equi]
MTAFENLFELNQGLSSIVRREVPSDDWMTRANIQSARSLRDLVHESWMPFRKGILARFHDGAVSGHTAPAYQVLRTASELNDAVVAVSNAMLEKPFATINDSVRKKLGLLMRPVLAGSVEIDLVCPIPGLDEDVALPNEIDGQTVMPELVQLNSVGVQALDRVLSVLRTATTPSDRDSLGGHSELIGVDGWQKVARLANRCVEADFTIDFTSRTDPSDWFSFAPSHAAALKSFIKDRSLTSVEVEYTGLWQTASSVRTWFDLETATKQRVSGTVPKDLLAESMQFLDQRVRIVVREDLDTEQEGPTVRRKLVRIEGIDH